MPLTNFKQQIEKIKAEVAAYSSTEPFFSKDSPENLARISHENSIKSALVEFINSLLPTTHSPWLAAAEEGASATPAKTNFVKSILDWMAEHYLKAYESVAVDSSFSSDSSKKESALRQSVQCSKEFLANYRAKIAALLEAARLIDAETSKKLSVTSSLSSSKGDELFYYDDRQLTERIRVLLSKADHETHSFTKAVALLELHQKLSAVLDELSCPLIDQSMGGVQTSQITLSAKLIESFKCWLNHPPQSIKYLDNPSLNCSQIFSAHSKVALKILKDLLFALVEVDQFKPAAEFEQIDCEKKYSDGFACLLGFVDAYAQDKIPLTTPLTDPHIEQLIDLKRIIFASFEDLGGLNDKILRCTFNITVIAEQSTSQSYFFGKKKTPNKLLIDALLRQLQCILRRKAENQLITETERVNRPS